MLTSKAKEKPLDHKRPKNEIPKMCHVDETTDQWIKEQQRKHGMGYSPWARWLFTKLRTLEQRGEIDLCP